MHIHTLISYCPFKLCMSLEYIHGVFVQAAVFQLCQLGLLSSFVCAEHGSTLVVVIMSKQGLIV